MLPQSLVGEGGCRRTWRMGVQRHWSNFYRIPQSLCDSTSRLKIFLLAKGGNMPDIQGSFRCKFRHPNQIFSFHWIHSFKLTAHDEGLPPGRLLHEGPPQTSQLSGQQTGMDGMPSHLQCFSTATLKDVNDVRYLRPSISLLESFLPAACCQASLF